VGVLDRLDRGDRREFFGAVTTVDMVEHCLSRNAEAAYAVLEIAVNAERW
jgi:hypothetical protein